MQTLRIKLTLNGPNRYKGKLSVQCYKPGTTTRHYMLVPGIESVICQNWDEDL